MKILVTGGAGYIGGTVTRLLLERGHSVVVYDNLCHAQRSMVPAGATFVEGDVADSKRLDELFADGSFDGVMHFAALIEAGESMRQPEVYFRNNTAATLSLLESMVRNNLQKLVFSIFDNNNPQRGRDSAIAIDSIAIAMVETLGAKSPPPSPRKKKK